MRLTKEREQEIREFIERYKAYPQSYPEKELLSEIDALRAQIVINYDEEEKVFDAWRKKVDYAGREIEELKKENETLRHEFKMAQASMPEVKALREENEILKSELNTSRNTVAHEFKSNQNFSERIKHLREGLRFYADQTSSIAEVTAPGWTARSALAADDELKKL